MDNLTYQSELDRLGYVISHNTNANWSMESYHFHEFFELNLSLSDEVSWFVADQVYQVKKGTLMILSDGDLHRSVSPSDMSYERYVLYFSPKYVEQLSTAQTDMLACFARCRLTRTHCLQLTDRQAVGLQQLLHKAEERQRGQAFGQDLHRQIALMEILLFINGLLQTTIMPKPVNAHGEMQRILPVITHIQRNLQADLSLDRLSQTFYLNKYHLGRLFKQATGFTVNEYIIHSRILRSRMLLRDNLPVHQVGQKVGFNNQSHFIRTFKQLVGTTPKQYQLAARAD